MRFDWVNVLATVIFISIVVTLILAVASYFAYKVREARRPKTAAPWRRDLDSVPCGKGYGKTAR